MMMEDTFCFCIQAQAQTLVELQSPISVAVQRNTNALISLLQTSHTLKKKGRSGYMMMMMMTMMMMMMMMMTSNQL